MASRERAVELSIVGNHLRIARELDKPRECLVRGGSIRHILVMNIRQMSNIIGNRFSRIDERHIPIDHFAVFHTRRSNLSKLIMIKGETRGFGVDHHNVLVKSTKIRFFCQIR